MGNDVRTIKSPAKTLPAGPFNLGANAARTERERAVFLLFTSSLRNLADRVAVAARVLREVVESAREFAGVRAMDRELAQRSIVRANNATRTESVIGLCCFDDPRAECSIVANKKRRMGQYFKLLCRMHSIRISLM